MYSYIWNSQYMKQDIHIYVAYSRPNGLTFLWTLMGGRGVLQANTNFFFLPPFFYPRATKGPPASI